jgi:hypothetical protein
VTGVVGRAELLASVFYLSAILSYARSSHRGQATDRRTRWKWLAASVIFTSLAMLSKEQGITVILVCVVYELLIVQKLHPADVITLN